MPRLVMSVSTNRKMVMLIYNDSIRTRFLAIGTSYGFSERGFDNETCNSTGVYNSNIPLGNAFIAHFSSIGGALVTLTSHYLCHITSTFD